MQETPDKVALAAAGRKRRLLRKTTVDEVKTELTSAMSAGEATQRPSDLVKEESDEEMEDEDTMKEKLQVKDRAKEDSNREVKEEDGVIDLEEKPDVKMEDLKNERSKMRAE